MHIKPYFFFQSFLGKYLEMTYTCQGANFQLNLVKIFPECPAICWQYYQCDHQWHGQGSVKLVFVRPLNKTQPNLSNDI